MIKLFHIPNYTIETNKLDHLLHGSIVKEFEEAFAEYVGAKYVCSTHSASAAIMMLLLSGYIKNDSLYFARLLSINLPSIIPYVVPNIIINCGFGITFNDNISWVGHAYTLYSDDYFKIIDSAQEVTRNQVSKLNKNDVVVYSFYPTKPVGSCDGGMIASNDKEIIDYIRKMSMYGTRFGEKTWDSWSRDIEFPGWKLYMNSIQARIAMNNLQVLDKKKEKLAEIRYFYNKHLGYYNTSYHLYRINVDNNAKFINFMNKCNIQCGIHYHPCHLLYAYLKYDNVTCEDELKKAVREGETTVSIPFHEMLTKDNLNYIIGRINEYKKNEYKKNKYNHH